LLVEVDLELDVFKTLRREFFGAEGQERGQADDEEGDSANHNGSVIRYEVYSIVLSGAQLVLVNSGEIMGKGGLTVKKIKKMCDACDFIERGAV